MPSGGRAKPDRSWAWTAPRRKHRWTLIAQSAVRSDLVVFLPEVAHHHPCFRQRPQLFPVQTFVPEPSVKALHKPVLPRAARLNVNRLDPVFFQPPLHDLRDELRAVVAPQKLRRPVLLRGFLQPAQHVRRLQGPFRPQHMALPRVFIQNRQHLQGAATHGRIRNEVPCPHMVPMRRRGGQPS